MNGATAQGEMTTPHACKGFEKGSLIPRDYR